MTDTATAPTPKPRRRGRWLRRVLIALPLVVIAVPVIAFALLQTGWGQRQVVAIADDALAASGLSLHVGDISGLFPFDMTITEFELDDVEGTAIEAENLRIAFGFWALFSGEVSVAELAASRLAVRRAPLTPPVPEAPVTEPLWPELPVDLAIDRIDIDRLELGAALTGSDMALTVDGSFALEPTGGEATLTIQSLEGRPARVDLSARIDRVRETLALDLVAEEPEGGVVPRLAGWDYDGPWRLTLTGDGPMDRWSGRLQAVAGTEELADIAISGALDLATPRLALSGVISPPSGLLPPGIDPSPIALDVVASLGEDGVTLTGAIDGRGAAVTIDATVGLDGPIALDADIDVVVDDLAQTLAGLELPLAGDLRAGIVANGALDDLTASVTLSAGAIDADQWQARNVSVDARFDGSVIGPSGTLTLTVAATNPTGPDFDFQAYAIDTVRLAATAQAETDGDQVAISGIVIEAGPHALSGSASLSLVGGPIGFDLAIGTDAAVALGLAGFDQASGQLDGRIVGAFDPGAGLGWIEASLAGAGLRLGDPLIDALAGGAPSILASGQIDTGYGVQGLAATIALPALTAEIGGDLAFDGSDDLAAPLTFTVTVESLAALAEPLGFAADGLAGAVTLAGAIGDPLSAAPRATIDLAGEGVTVGGTAFGAISTTLALAPDPSGAVLANVQASTGGDYGPVSSALEATYDPTTSIVQVHAVNLSAFGSGIEGDLAVDLDTLAVNGTLQLSVGDLNGLRAVTGTTLAGNVSARISLEGDGQQQNATIALNARALELPDAARIENLDADVSIADLYGDIRLNGRASAATVTAEDVSFDNLTIDASGSLQALDLTIAAAGDSTAFADPVPVKIDTVVRIEQSDAGLGVRIAELTADLGDEQIVLQQPANLRFGGSAFALTDLQLSLLGGNIAGSIRISPASVDVDIEVTSLDLGRASALTIRSELGARLDRLAIRLEGTGASPNGTIELSATGVMVGSETSVRSALNNAELIVTAQVRAGMVAVDARIDNITDDPIILRLTNALRLSLAPFVADFDHGQPLDGQFLARSNLEMVSGFVAPSGNILLSGDSNIDIAIGGVGGAPVLTGAGTISGASLEVVDIGLILVNLNAEIGGDGDQLVLRSLTAADPRGGSLHAGGFVDFGAQGQASIEINATLNQLNVHNTQLADVEASGTVAITGPLTGPEIQGDITIRPAEIQFAELPGAGYVEVDAIDVNGESRIPPEPIDFSPPLAIPLDITVSVPNALYVRGYGLDTEWSGNLKIVGSTRDPVITGTLTVLRGTMSLGGQGIEIGRGIVTFTGATPPDPLIDIEAYTEGNDLRAVLTIRGPASSAKFELSSVPPLPQEEILGRLLFGVGRGGLGSNQAFQAGRALALLSGDEGDLGIVNTLRGITGITGLSIEADTDSEGNPAARVGGYLSEDVFVSVSRGSATSSGEAEISIEVFDGVDINSAVTESGDSEIGLSFEWDY